MEEAVRKLIKNAISKSYTYKAYRKLTDTLAEAEKSTGDEQSEALSHYTLLNAKRMKRLDKTAKLSAEELSAISKTAKKLTWLVITESWCGDAAQTLPIINKIAEASPFITLKIVLRDENKELMDNFLTRGSRSIPKLIMVDEQVSEVLDCWGPRPTIATGMVKNFKAEHGKLTPGFKQELQVWYNKDKGRNTVEDMLKLLSLK
ncbi:thioredoxin family protein [Galbibacter sp. PAP.153]|uniref:thioredoxin family protein n=1 Tax=Galbibacter sp. PAP.153 TaxID=3104623 RepID=UPI00300A93A6